MVIILQLHHLPEIEHCPAISRTAYFTLNADSSHFHTCLPSLLTCGRHRKGIIVCTGALVRSYTNFRTSAVLADIRVYLPGASS